MAWRVFNPRGPEERVCPSLAQRRVFRLATASLLVPHSNFTMANRDHLFDPHFHSISPVQEDYPMGKGGQRFEPEPAGSPGPNTFSFTDRAGASKDQVSDRAGPHFHRSIGPFQLQNTHNPYQSSPGPTRTGHTSNLDRGMIGGSDARATDRWPGPGLDPLTPAPPLTSHFRPLALHSMVMVIPETTAGTHAKKSTEQNGTPVSEFYRFHDPCVTGQSAQVQRIPPFRPPHGTGTVNLEREMAQEDVRELCSLVTRWKKLCKLVFLNVALTREYVSHQVR